MQLIKKLITYFAFGFLWLKSALSSSYNAKLKILIHFLFIILFSNIKKLCLYNYASIHICLFSGTHIKFFYVYSLRAIFLPFLSWYIVIYFYFFELETVNPVQIFFCFFFERISLEISVHYAVTSNKFETW